MLLKAIILCLGLTCFIVQASKPSIPSETSQVFTTLLKAFSENGDMKEIKVLMELANKALPALKEYMQPKSTKSSPRDQPKFQGNLYTYCTGNPSQVQACAQFYLTFDIGWTSNQLSDQYRIYNLTIAPYTYIGLNVNLTLQSGAIGLSMSPYLTLVDWQMPISFELVSSNMFCFNAFQDFNPILLGSYFGANFLECNVDVSNQPLYPLCDTTPLT